MARVAAEMLRPILEQPVPAVWHMGSHLTVGIEAKAGRNWLEMEKITVPGVTELGLTEQGGSYLGVEEIDEDDVSELEVVA